MKKQQCLLCNKLATKPDESGLKKLCLKHYKEKMVVTLEDIEDIDPRINAAFYDEKTEKKE